MKKTILTIVMAIFAITAFAQKEENNVRIPSGYQGFLEIGNTWHVIDNHMPTTMNLSTTHGFYFNGRIFAGVGIGVDFCSDHTLVPIYANMRYVFINNKAISPVLSLRLGSFMSEEVGAYGDLGIGVRFASKRDFAINVMVAGTYYDKIWHYYQEDYIDEYGYHHNDWTNGKVSPSGVSLRIGIEW